jgi:hypothetical protein
MSARSNSEPVTEGSNQEPSVVAEVGTIPMPCGARARLTPYVAYQTLTFAERDVLLAALAEAGYHRVEAAPLGTETANPVPVLDSDRRLVGGAAIVVRREHLAAGFGDLAFVLTDGAYVPLVPSDARTQQLLQRLRTCYGRAKASQLAEQARRRFAASVQRSLTEDGSVTIRVRF